ncbi:ABC transporter ATP-binding protein [Niallia circulans]|uniref:ABC transporter ATP-binding protein n=1 Tax=Niallia circulans TaxID=1397 RepID=A0A553SHZ4_NIACI|nr:ABC transporter ATP-binding protein [Niallia circulans]TRZ36601.1 ABC transporter ATP-binding protein [Niallia circulans]
MHKLEIKNSSKIFRKDNKDFYALKDTSLQIEAGSFVSIIGPSGCGKSTLFNIIAGLIKPSTGEVLLDGKDIIGRNGYVGYMLQKDLLLPWRTIMHNVILGLEIKGISKKEAISQAAPLLERYGLGGFENHYPDELSGGMRQRAALLRTLLYDQDIILLDEPFGALDAQTRLLMQEWLLQIWVDFKKTILFITHDIDEAIFLSDDIYILTPRPGTIKEKVTVPLARPRNAQTLLSPEFIELKEHVLKQLKTEG